MQYFLCEILSLLLPLQTFIMSSQHMAKEHVLSDRQSPVAAGIPVQTVQPHLQKDESDDSTTSQWVHLSGNVNAQSVLVRHERNMDGTRYRAAARSDR